jgi:hypothetical protein
MPADSKVSCRTAGKWPSCECTYDISSNTFCNENNTVCEGDSSVCTVNFTKNSELPGGICPAPDNTYTKIYDQKCSCNISRNYGPWVFSVEKCGGTDNKTSIGTKTRTITITKTGGNKACKIRPENNEELLENTTGVLNKGGYFQFKPEVDVVGGTFQTVQKEIDYYNTDDNSCICEGTTWVDVTSCPSRTDYTKSDDKFYKTQRKTTTKTIPGIKCDERRLRCPRDCSGSFVNGVCKDIYGLPISCTDNTSGTVQGTITNTFEVFKTRLDGEDNNGSTIPGIACPSNYITSCNLKCDVDCVGTWRDMGYCKIDRCDPSKNTVGLGKQRQEFVVQTYSQNEGKPCPGPTREIDCSLNNYEDCVTCKGQREIGASCENIKTCDGLIGIGERIDKWSSGSLTVLPYCVMPADSKVSCRTAGKWPSCECTYDISSNTFCNENNTVCTSPSSSICTVNFTKTNQLPGGICTEQEPRHNNVNVDKCVCTVTRTYANFGNWQYTNPRCDPSNRTTLIADSRSRTRTITITKTGGNKACIIHKLPNETILDTPANVGKGTFRNNILQFGSTNDSNGSTFQTVETEIENNVSLPDNASCKCQGTYSRWGTWAGWTNNSACPSATDYNAAESAFTITQNRSRTRTFTISNTASLLTNSSCPEAAPANLTETERQNFTCPRHCNGTWNGWGSCNNACPGNATAANNRISSKNSTGGQATRTRTFKVTTNRHQLGTGTGCPADQTENCSRPCPVGSCPSGYTMGSSNCTQNCPSNYVNSSGACLGVDYASEQVSACPSGYFFWYLNSNSNGTCVTCHRGSSDFNTTTSTCSRPNELMIIPPNCPSGYRTLNGSTASSNCYKNCDANFTFNSQNKKCETNHRYTANTTPITYSCPSGYTVSNGLCV